MSSESANTQQDPNLGERPLADVNIPEWDRGVFAQELVNQAFFPRPLFLSPKGSPTGPVTPPPPLPTGTFDGSQLAGIEMFRRIKERYVFDWRLARKPPSPSSSIIRVPNFTRFRSFFDIANFESSVPQDLQLDAKKLLYTFQEPGSDKYPPHLNMIPPNDQVGLLQIFDSMRLLDTGTLLGRVIPEDILDFIHSHPESDTLAGIEERNRILRQDKKDIFNEPNIGDRSDWYTDAVFAQQQFTGVNPTTISLASVDWVERFKNAAKSQGNQMMVQLLSTRSTDSVYIQDCSYFREAVGVSPDAVLMSDDGTRFCCAAVSIFLLTAVFSTFGY